MANEIVVPFICLGVGTRYILIEDEYLFGPMVAQPPDVPQQVEFDISVFQDDWKENNWVVKKCLETGDDIYVYRNPEEGTIVAHCGFCNSECGVRIKKNQKE